MKTLLSNFLFIECIVMSCICGASCIAYLLMGDILSTILCGIGMAVGASIAATIKEIK